MSTISLKCQDQALTFEHTPLIASGGKEENFAKFDFCQLWDGFTKTAFFWTKDNKVAQATLDCDDTCVIPAAVTAKEGTIYFGVVGVNTAEEQRSTFAVPYWVGVGVANPSVEVVDFYTHLLAELAGIASAIPSSEKGTAKGVATLDSAGKIPLDQTPIICPQLAITAEKGTTVTVYDGEAYSGTLIGSIYFEADGTKLVSVPSFGTFTAFADYYGVQETQTVTIDKVQRYPLTFELEFQATFVIWTEPAIVGATVTAVGRETGYTATGVTGDDGVARFDVHEVDDYDVTATIEGSGVFLPLSMAADGSSEFHDMLYYLDAVLDNNTWASIERASRLGLAPELWQVGDTKTVTCSDGNDRTFAIVGFDHDERADGTGKAAVTFALNVATDADVMAMQGTASNAGGFLATQPCPYLNDTMLNSILPSDLKEAIKPINKKTSAGNTSTTLLTEELALFLFSEVELCGSATKSAAGEGVQYPYFATTNNRKFYNAANAAKAYWLRSPSSADATEYVAIASRGTLTTTAATTATYYLRFGFCI